MTISLLVVFSIGTLTACGTTRVNGGVAVDMPAVPVKKPLMESDVAFYIEDLRGAVKQCNANFKSGQ